MSAPVPAPGPLPRHGGRILADALAAHGVERVFSVPGESFLAALDGLLDACIDNVVCRHEGGAAMMAEATGKLTGRPGVVFVTRGPGACNAAAGLHVARQDSTPLVCFVGQVPRGHRDREAFQEIDYRAVLGPMVKWVAEVDEVGRLPEYLRRAFRTAVTGRPGPVVLALPEDMLSAVAEVADLPPAPPPVPGVTAAQVEALLAPLRRAERPLVIAGGGAWSQQAADDLARFAGTNRLPVAASFRRQGHVDNGLPVYAGDLGVGMNPGLARRLGQADCLLVLGARLGEIASDGYAALDPARPGPAILHVHPDPDMPGRVFGAEVALAADPAAVLARLSRVDDLPGWADWTAAARAEYEAWHDPKPTPGEVRMEEVVAWLSAHLPDDAIVTNGAGNYAAFLHRYYGFRRWGTQLAPTSGSMGYGFPAAVAASLAHPDRTVVCMAGDGCFQMTLNEMSTAVQHGARPVVIVANNGQYGTIRMHQERRYPGRVSGTALANPDFAALARAYGGHGERIERQQDFAAAFDRARASRLPAVIELVLDPEALTPGATLSQVRGTA